MPDPRDNLCRRARAYSGGNHTDTVAEGVIVAVCTEPTYTIRTADGEHTHWAASLTEVGELVPDHEIPRSAAWRPGDGDTRCQDCGKPYRPWFTDNWLWNLVMGGPDATDDPGGCLCPRCFTARVPGVGVWRLVPAPPAPMHERGTHG